VPPIIRKLAIIFALLIALASAAYFFPVLPALHGLVLRVSQLGWIGVFCLSFAIAAGSIFFLPASPFVVAAAALFGFWTGLGASLTGIALGATLGFALSRWFLRKEIANQFQRHPTFTAIDTALEKEGWKIAFVLRLCPIPFGLANYLFGLTALRYRPYLVTTLLGALPALALFSHLGSTGKAGLDAIASGAAEERTGELIMIGLSILATLIGIFLIPRFAHQAVKKYAPAAAGAVAAASPVPAPAAMTDNK
jgi:uncharacterized membrane protein YdjX (TVP38/TMEM64 family)